MSTHENISVSQGFLYRNRFMDRLTSCWLTCEESITQIYNTTRNCLDSFISYTALAHAALRVVTSGGVLLSGMHNSVIPSTQIQQYDEAPRPASHDMVSSGFLWSEILPQQKRTHLRPTSVTWSSAKEDNFSRQSQILGPNMSVLDKPVLQCESGILGAIETDPIHDTSEPVLLLLDQDGRVTGKRGLFENYPHLRVGQIQGIAIKIVDDDCWIAFSFALPGQLPDMWKIRAGGTDLTRLTYSPNQAEINPEASKLNDRILFTVSTHKGQTIMSMDWQGQDTKKFMEGYEIDTYPYRYLFQKNGQIFFWDVSIGLTFPLARGEHPHFNWNGTGMFFVFDGAIYFIDDFAHPQAHYLTYGDTIAPSTTKKNDFDIIEQDGQLYRLDRATNTLTQITGRPFDINIYFRLSPHLRNTYVNWVRKQPTYSSPEWYQP